MLYALAKRLRSRSSDFGTVAAKRLGLNSCEALRGIVPPLKRLLTDGARLLLRSYCEEPGSRRSKDHNATAPFLLPRFPTKERARLKSGPQCRIVVAFFLRQPIVKALIAVQFTIRTGALAFPRTIALDAGVLAGAADDLVRAL